MKKFLMKSKNIAIIGVLSWILGVITSATDDSGNFVMPFFLISISGITTFTFNLLAIIRLWKSEKYLSITLIVVTVGLTVLMAIQEVTLPKYGSPIILITNVVNVADFIIFVYAVCLLWAKSKHEDV